MAPPEAPRTEEGSPERLLRWLIGQAKNYLLPGTAQPSLGDWWRAYLEAAPEWPVPIDRAIVGGFLSDRFAYAFAAGYQSALQRLVPHLPQDRIASLCITEEGGGHPRSILASLRPIVPGSSDPTLHPGWTLSGRKRWATASLEASRLLVAASLGVDPAGRNRIRLVELDSHAPGITIRPMPDVPFIPEISHGEIQLDEVRIEESQVLPGDGYTGYIRPFRTIEDTHVGGALLGHLLRMALRFRWPRSIPEELLHLIASLRALALLDPSAPEMHIALGGLLSAEQRVLDAIQPRWAETDPETRARWERDSVILTVAANARTQRLDSAWEALAPAPSAS